MSRAAIIAAARRRYLCAVFLGRADIMQKTVRVFHRLAAR